MRLALVLLLLLLSASGCCPKPAPEVRYVPHPVEIPVVVTAPEPPTFVRQPLPIQSVPDDAPAREVLRRLVATIVLLQGEVEMRDQALDAHREPRYSPSAVLPSRPFRK